jgi:hypothetical protein
MNMKKLAVCLGLILGVKSVQAQKYITAAGVRISKQQLGLTVQQRVLPKSTIELIGSVGSNEYSGTALFERHYPIITKGLNYYLGAGAHVGKIKDRGGFYGGDVILGAEMKLPFLPLTLSADLKPAFHAHHTDWFTFGGGFSVRYILIKEKKKKKSKGIFSKEYWSSDDNDEEDSGFFGKKEKEESKSKFSLFGGEETKNKEKTKFRLFPKKEEPAPEPEKKKFNLFGK